MRSALITGASGGIGLGITERLLADGWRVAALDRDIAALPDHPDLIALAGDVRTPSATQNAAARLLEITGRIDALVTCAAIYPMRPFLDLDEELWDSTFAANATGGLLACQAVLPAMRAQGAGSIVLFSSTLARHGQAGGAHYAASKGAVLGLARSLALETARQGIRVNTVSPGITDTPQPRANMSDAQLHARAADIPLGRIGAVADMVEATAFLLSDDASYITGQDIRLTGGARLF
jgi:2-hydroxycyclohexanecarboxyl-CoA dehydrogenase